MFWRFATYLLSILCAMAVSAAHAEEKTFSFAVLPQRSAVLTAQYWNPILEYVSHKAGVTLQLKMSHTAPECNQGIAKGDYDFVYSNTIFRRANLAAGYQVILRPQGEDITGQIVTLTNSPLKSLPDLEGKIVGFPSLSAFAGFLVPMDHLRQEGINVTPVFGGNQEGIIGQLVAGRVIAAGVNGQVMKAYAAREKVSYRVLWESQQFLGMPISTHPRVAKDVKDVVLRAFLEMSNDPEGKRILETSAAIIKQSPPYGFLAATQDDYRNYIDVYQNNRVKEAE